MGSVLDRMFTANCMRVDGYSVLDRMFAARLDAQMDRVLAA